VGTLVKDAEISATLIDEYPESARAGHLIGRRARYADVTIIGPDLLANETLKSKTIDSGLFESGRPILVIPRGSKPTLRPKCVLRHSTLLAMAWFQRTFPGILTTSMRSLRAWKKAASMDASY
jgi:hypothetical protein